MADLGVVLGAIVTGLARAREVADAETAAAAERYRENPLLEGLTVPRIRVPEMVLELPLFVTDEAPGQAAVPEQPEVVAAKVSAAMTEELKAVEAEADGVNISDAVASVQQELPKRLQLVGRGGSAVKAGRRVPPKESTIRLAEIVVKESLDGAKVKLSATEQTALLERVRAAAESAADASPPVAAGLGVSVLTSEVKEKSAPGNVARITLTLREEGVEWTQSENRDGTTSRRLTPE